MIWTENGTKRKRMKMRKIRAKAKELCWETKDVKVQKKSHAAETMWKKIIGITEDNLMNQRWIKLMT